MNPLTTLRSALLGIVLAVSLPAQSTSYQDMWWNPNESGWGLNLTQQGDTIFAIWFVYDATRRGTWFVSDCPLVDNRTCTGILYATTGPAYTARAFNPKDVTETQVGSASFVFTDANHGTLTYSVSGARVTKSIVRYTYAAPPIAGTYWIAGSGLADRCDAYGSFTYHYDNAGLALAVTGPRLDLVFKLYNEADWDAAYSCTAGGPYTQWGSQIAFSAPYSCSDGISGTLAIPDLNINERGLVAKLAWTHGLCVESENVTGVRHPVTPNPTPGTIALGAASYTVAEGPATALVTVLRTGGSSGMVTVGYATADGTAKAGEDYTATIGNLTFGDGDATPKTIAIPILGDAALEITESFTLTLTSISGGATLGAPSSATINVTDTTRDGTACEFTCSANVPAFALAGAQVGFGSDVTNANCPGTLTQSWVFGDGTTSAIPSPSRSYGVAGTYIWSLAVAQGASRCTRSGTILVGGAAPGGVSVSPPSAALHPYGSQTFTASVPGEPPAEIVWAVQEGPGLTGGLIGQDGTYSAPPKPGTYHVVAVNRKNPAQWGSATVTSTDSTVAGETKTGVVGPSGGTVTLSNGIALVVPSGAAAAGVTATLSLITNDPLFGDSLHTVVGLTFSGAVTAARLDVPVAPGAVADRYAGAFYDPANPVFKYLTPTVNSSTVSLDLAAANSAPASASTSSRKAAAGAPAGVIPLAGRVAVERGVADPAGTGPVGPIAIPYMEQGTAEGACWAAALDMFHKGYEKDPGVYNTIPWIFAYFGVSKDSGVDSEAFHYLLNGGTFARLASRVSSRNLSKQINLSFYNFVAYVKEQTKAGKPVLANLVWHAGVFLGYEGNYLYYHDPANVVQGEAVPGYRRFPYTRVAIEDLRREFFVRNWYDHLALNALQSWVADIPPTSPNLQTLGFPDSGPSDLSKTFTGIGFEVPSSAGRLQMLDKVSWDHTQRYGYSHLVPEVPPTVENIVIKDLPVFNMDRSHEAKVKIKVRVVSYDLGAWKYPPLWQTELEKTLPAFPASDPASARQSYSVIIPFQEVAAKILPDDDKLSLVFELFDGQGTRLDHFNTDFTLGGPFITSISPDPAETNGMVTLEGFGFGGPENKVMFTSDGGRIAATSIVGWSDNKVSAKVPVGAKTGPVTVTRGTTTSNSVPLAVEGIWNPDARADVSFYVTRMNGTSKQACQNFTIQIFRDGNPVESGSSVARNGLFDTTLKIGSGYTYVIDATYTNPPETKRIYGSVVVLDRLNFFEVSTSTSTASVAIYPASATLPLGGTRTFAASVTAAGTSTDVAWIVRESGGGTVTALDSNQGVYKAPAVAGTYHVVARATADSTKFAEATVTVTNVVKVALTPSGGALAPGGSMSFTATVTGATNAGVTWSTSGGSLVPESDVKATFTAPSAAGTYTITATAKADPTKKATASVVVVTDTTKTLSFGGNSTFSMRLGSIAIPVAYQTSGTVTAPVIVGGTGQAIVPGWYGGATTGGVFGGMVLVGCGTSSKGIQTAGSYTATATGATTYRDDGQSSDSVYTVYTLKKIHYETCRTTDQIIGGSGQSAGWKLACAATASLDATLSCSEGAAVLSQALGDVEEIRYRKSDNGEVSRGQYTVNLPGPGISIGF